MGFRWTPAFAACVVVCAALLPSSALSAESNVAVLNSQLRHYPKVVASAVSTNPGHSPSKMFEGHTEEEIAGGGGLGGRYVELLLFM